MSIGQDGIAVKAAVIAEKQEDDQPLTEFNTWLKGVEKQLALYPANLQVQAANHLYTETYNRLEADVNAHKATLTVAEKTFSGMLFKVTK